MAVLGLNRCVPRACETLPAPSDQVRGRWPRRVLLRLVLPVLVDLVCTGRGPSSVSARTRKPRSRSTSSERSILRPASAGTGGSEAPFAQLVLLRRRRRLAVAANLHVLRSGRVAPADPAPPAMGSVYGEAGRAPRWVRGGRVLRQGRCRAVRASQPRKARKASGGAALERRSPAAARR